MNKVTVSSPEELAEQLKDERIVKQGRFGLASGLIATQKLEWSNVDRRSEAYQNCKYLGAQKIARIWGSAVNLVPIPTGANQYARDIATVLGSAKQYREVLKKPDPKTRELVIAEEYIGKIDLLKPIILIDDIFTTGSSLTRAKNLLGDTVIGALAIWDRATALESEEYRHRLFLEHELMLETLIQQHVPLHAS